MSRSVDLFIDADLTLAQLASRLNELAGVSLVPTDDAGSFVMAGSSMDARLSGHGYADDDELWLTRYRYVLSASVPGEANPRDSRQASILRAISEALRGEMAVLVVIDLQYRDAPAGSTEAAQ